MNKLWSFLLTKSVLFCVIGFSPLSAGPIVYTFPSRLISRGNRKPCLSMG